LLPSRQGDDQVTVNRRRRAPGDDQPAMRAARHFRKAAFDFGGIAHIDWAQLHPKRRSCGLDCAPLADPSEVAGIPEDPCARHARRDLLKQFQKFPAD